MEFILVCKKFANNVYSNCFFFWDRRINVIFCKNEMKFCSFHFIRAKFWTRFLLKFWDLSGAKECKSCRSRKMLQNASFLAIVAVDTAENEPLKIWGDLFIISIVSLVRNFTQHLMNFIHPVTLITIKCLHAFNTHFSSKCSSFQCFQ